MRDILLYDSIRERPKIDHVAGKTIYPMMMNSFLVCLQVVLDNISDPLCPLYIKLNVAT